MHTGKRSASLSKQELTSLEVSFFPFTWNQGMRREGIRDGTVSRKVWLIFRQFLVWMQEWLGTTIDMKCLDSFCSVLRDGRARCVRVEI